MTGLARSDRWCRALSVRSAVGRSAWSAPCGSPTQFLAVNAAIPTAMRRIARCAPSGTSANSRSTSARRAPRAEVLPKSHRAWRAGNYLIVTSLGCAFGCGQRRTRRPPRRDYSMPRIITPCRSIGRWKRRANSRSVSSAE